MSQLRYQSILTHRKDYLVNQKKLEEYELCASIDTASIKSPGVVKAVPDEITETITSNTQYKKSGEVITTSKINPNKLVGDIFSFKEFQAAMGTIMAEAGIDQYNFIRTDLRLDNYDPEHYERYAKLNRYLISMLAVAYKNRNNYRTEDLFTQKQVSVAIKNDSFETENYDRAAKSRNTGNTSEPAQARLEERTVIRGWRKLYEKAQAEDGTDLNMELLKKEFMTGWKIRWKKAIKNIEKVHQKYNEALAALYMEGKDCFPKKWRSLTDFLIQYQNCIFSKKQLIDLLSRFPEVKDPKIRAENHKKRYGIEYFSKKDVEKAIAEIQRATEQFFLS